MATSADGAASPPQRAPVRESTPRWAFYVLGAIGVGVLVIAIAGASVRRHARRTPHDEDDAPARSANESDRPTGRRSIDPSCPGAACATPPFTDMSQVPPREALGAAAALARTVDADAQLASLSARDVWTRGALDLRGDAPEISFVFSATNRTVVVALAKGLLVAHLGHEKFAGEPLPIPDCDFDRVWAVAEHAGFPRDGKASLFYRRDSAGAALISESADRHVLYLDPTTCEVVREFR